MNLRALADLLLLDYYAQMLDKHIDLVQRRLINKETIPHSDKLFSIYEPYTEWISKGKSGKNVELGLKVCIATDGGGMVLHHWVMENSQDVDLAVKIVRFIIKNYGPIKRISFDKGFWSPSNYETINEMVEELILPKKGKCNKEEHAREHSPSFIKGRHAHSAVESDINALEHHGLNRVPDKGITHFKSYVALGIISLNLHRFGNELIKKSCTHVRKRSA